MGRNASEDEIDNIDWDTEDEEEIQKIPSPHCSTLANSFGNGIHHSEEASSSADPSRSKLIQHFIAMGFPEKLISKAIDENGEDTELILESLLTYSALDNSPQQQQCLSSGESSSGFDPCFLDDFSEADSWSENELTENETTSTPGKERTMLSLAKMGYSVEEASIAIDRCGPEATIAELADFICAAQLARAEDIHLPDAIKPKPSHMYDKSHKRKLHGYEFYKNKKRKEILDRDDMIRLPKPMIGFGVPTESGAVVDRKLPDLAIGPPFFYYENVALAPKGVWDTISRSLYDVEPEFVDSCYFCATARKRGYVHNLPIKNRYPLLPLPPLTIRDALPLTRKWWPSWDTREKLNCIQTVIGSAKMTDRIRKALEHWDSNPPLGVQKYVLDECKKWNFVWVGRNKVAPLEPDEVEMLLGFPRNHTRGISRTDRYKSLGNSFQIDTVAYHLSVLKDLFPNGMNILSLFSGIGGAEVALHRLGIRLKNVVSVEISEVNRNVLKCWWEQTNQKGNLVELGDVQELNADKLDQLIQCIGGFDLVIGGSPCNNLTGGNRVSRDGLEGKDSALFFDFVRVLDLVKCIQGA